MTLRTSAVRHSQHYTSAEGNGGPRQGEARERKRESKRVWRRGRSASVLLMDESIRKSMRQASKLKKRHVRFPLETVLRVRLFK